MIKFILFTIFGLVVPGYVLIRKKLPERPVLSVFISVCVGVAALTLSAYIGSLLQLDWLIFVFLFICNLVFFYKKYYLDFLNQYYIVKLDGYLGAVYLLILAGTIFQCLMMFRSGRTYDFGVGYWGPLGHDGLWHQALVNQLIRGIPPENPIFSGAVLKNYHYFYDLLVAISFNLTHIPTLDLIYRYYPVIFSLLLGIGTYHLSNALFRSRLANIFSLYFVFFGSSFGWVVEFIRERHFGGESAFWMNQPVSMNLNPPFAISLLMIIALVLLLIDISKDRDARLLAPIVILSGTLIEFKVYAGLIVLGSLLFIGLRNIFLHKDFFLLKIFIFSFGLAVVLFVPQSFSSSDFVEFKPFWFVHSMIDSPDRVGWFRLSTARQAYASTSNWLKLLGAEILALGIFVVGNLGTRIVGLLYVSKSIVKRVLGFGKDIVYSITGIALIIPILFIQKGNPWNTIQFSYYFLYFFALYAGAAWADLFGKVPRSFYTALVIFVLIITPISSITTFTFGLYKNPPSMLPANEFEALTYLSKQENGVVLTYPYRANAREMFSSPYPLFAYETSSYVSAFSKKNVFVEDEIQGQILAYNYKIRIDASNRFFGSEDEKGRKEFLKVNNIRYIYIPSYFEVPLDDSFLEQIFSNSGASIYKVII